MGMFSGVTKTYSVQPCTNCGDVEVPGQWWHMSNYFGIHGYFCPKCSELISHDPYKKPNHPNEFKAIAVAQQIQRATKNA